MKVKVGDKVYDGAKEPVMVILSDFDKVNIANMPANMFRYASAPHRFDTKVLLKWMKSGTTKHLPKRPKFNGK